MSLQYMYEATLVFKEVTTGLFKIIKDKRSLDLRGFYCTTERVADYLNRDDLKVSLFDNRDIHIDSNFKLGEGIKTTL